MSPLARLCCYHGCMLIIPAGAVYCARHGSAIATHENQRRNARPVAAIYKDPRHKAWRKRIIDQAGGWCEIRLPGCTKKATIADHHPIPARDCPDPYTARGRAACHHCSGTTDGQRSHGGGGVASPALGPLNPIASQLLTETGDGHRPQAWVA